MIPRPAANFKDAALDDFFRQGAPLAPFRHERGQLRSKTGRAEKSKETRAFQEADKKSGLAPLAPFLTVAKASALAGVSKQTIKNAIHQKRLDYQSVIDTAGANKGRPKYLIPAQALFALYPAALISWQSEQEALGRERELGAAKARAAMEAAKAGAAKTSKGAARQWHCMRLAGFKEERGLGAKAALAQYIEALARGHIGAPPEVRAAFPKGGAGFSAVSLERWALAYRKEGAGGLDSKYRGNPFGHFARNPGQAEYAAGLVYQFPHIQSARIWEALGAKFGAAPSYRTVARWRSKWAAA